MRENVLESGQPNWAVLAGARFVLSVVVLTCHLTAVSRSVAVAADVVRLDLHRISRLLGFRNGRRDGAFDLQFASFHVFATRCESTQLPGRLQLSTLLVALANFLGVPGVRRDIATVLPDAGRAGDVDRGLGRQRAQAFCHNKTRRFVQILKRRVLIGRWTTAFLELILCVLL